MQRHRVNKKRADKRPAQRRLRRALRAISMAEQISPLKLLIRASKKRSALRRKKRIVVANKARLGGVSSGQGLAKQAKAQRSVTKNLRQAGIARNARHAAIEMLSAARRTNTVAILPAINTALRSSVVGVERGRTLQQTKPHKGVAFLLKAARKALARFPKNELALQDEKFLVAPRNAADSAFSKAGKIFARLLKSNQGCLNKPHKLLKLSLERRTSPRNRNVKLRTPNKSTRKSITAAVKALPVPLKKVNNTQSNPFTELINFAKRQPGKLQLKPFKTTLGNVQRSFSTQTGSGEKGHPTVTSKKKENISRKDFNNNKENVNNKAYRRPQNSAAQSSAAAKENSADIANHRQEHHTEKSGYTARKNYFISYKFVDGKY